MKNKEKVGKIIAYCVGVFAIILSGIVIATNNYELYAYDNEDDDVEIQNYVYLEPEVNFIDDLELKIGSRIKLLDLVKNSSNCVILDDNKYADTSTIGMKVCTIRVLDDLGQLKEINFNVNVIE